MLSIQPIQSISVAPLKLEQLTPGTEAHSKRAFVEMEQMFIHQLLKEMRKSVPQSSLFGESRGKAFFEDMMDEVFAEKMAESGQFGIAKEMEAQYRAQQLHETVKQEIAIQRRERELDSKPLESILLK